MGWWVGEGAREGGGGLWAGRRETTPPPGALSQPVEREDGLTRAASAKHELIR